jgi:uncharacterized membrane protein
MDFEKELQEIDKDVMSFSDTKKSQKPSININLFLKKYKIVYVPILVYIISFAILLSLKPKFVKITDDDDDEEKLSIMKVNTYAIFLTILSLGLTFFLNRRKK